MRKPAHFDDLQTVPAHLTGEILEGELVVSQPPTAQAVLTRAALNAELARRWGGAEGGGSAGWWLADGAQLRLGLNALVPDIVGWRRQRLHRAPGAVVDVAPDWVCEILTPSTAIIDRTRKLGIYASRGVAWVWLVEPVHRTVEVLWLEGDEWVVAGNYGGDQKARIPPFDAIELQLGGLWAAPEAPSASPLPAP
jgi:Uma2 family endonuclease